MDDPEVTEMKMLFANRIRFKRIFLVCVISTILVCTALLSRQNNAMAADDATMVDQVIDKFQTEYSAKNLPGVQTLFHPQAIVGIQFGNESKPDIMTVGEWAQATKSVFKERAWVSDKLTNREISIHRGKMASVTCDYDYKDPSSHQAGTDIFTLIKVRNDWKIVSLVFTGDYVKK
jgi:hypothetical protein